MASAEPQVSVIVRTRNRPFFLRRALADILAQTEADWEIVLLNDHGDAAEFDLVVADALGGDRRLRLIDVPASVERDGILGIGFAACRGEFVAVHDDDDTWAPDFLRNTVSWLTSRPDDVAVAVATAIVTEQVVGDEVVEVSTAPLTPPYDVLSFFDLILTNRVAPIGMVLRRSAVDAVGGFDASLSVLGDWDLNLRLAAHGRIGYISGPPLASWHHRPDDAGAIGNSVFTASGLHERTDREMRDRALREYVERHGVGGLLYLSKFIDERISETHRTLHDQITESERRTRDHLGNQISELGESLTHLTARLEASMDRSARRHSLQAAIRRRIDGIGARLRRSK